LSYGGATSDGVLRVVTFGHPRGLTGVAVPIVGTDGFQPVGFDLDGGGHLLFQQERRRSLLGDVFGPVRRRVDERHEVLVVEVPFDQPTADCLLAHGNAYAGWAVVSTDRGRRESRPASDFL